MITSFSRWFSVMSLGCGLCLAPMSVRAANDQTVDWRQSRDQAKDARWQQNKERISQKQEAKSNWRDARQASKEERRDWRQARDDMRQGMENWQQARQELEKAFREARAAAIASFDQRPIVEWNNLSAEDINAWFSEGKGETSVLTVPEGKAITIKINFASDLLTLGSEDPAQAPVLRLVAKKPISLTVFRSSYWIKSADSQWREVSAIIDKAQNQNVQWSHDNYGPVITIGGVVKDTGSKDTEPEPEDREVDELE